MCQTTLYFVTLLLLQVATSNDFREHLEPYAYCTARYRTLCQGKGKHVACQFPAPGPSEYCENYTQIKFGSNMRNFITHYINRRRQRVAAGHERVRGGVHIPRPQIMTYVEWDRELAMLAQRLADQCSFVHDECRATVKYPYAGQTVGEVRWRKAKNSDDSLSAQRAIRRVLDAWWGEKRRVNLKQLTAPFAVKTKGIVWGHFSQLIIWPLRAVGCGAVRHGANFPRLLLVCDFSHTNMLGQHTIDVGPLLPCPKHTARKIHTNYPILCAPVRSNKQETEEEYYSDEDDNPPQYLEMTSESIRLPYRETQSTRMEGSWRKGKSTITTKILRHHSRPETRDQEKENEMMEGAGDGGGADGDGGADVGGARGPAPVAEELVESKDTLGYWRRRTKQTSTTQLPRSRAHIQDIMMYRKKWQQTRRRPPRPGFSALLSPRPKYFGVTEKASTSFLQLDKDGLDQLYIDTGFKPGRQRPPFLP